MADIAIRSRSDTPGALCDIHHIARSMLHQIGEDHRIVGYTQEASTSHEPFIRPPVSSTPSRMQPVRGRGRGRGGVDRRGRARDGGTGHCPDSESGLGTPEPTMPTSIPSYSYDSPEPFIPPHTYTSPSIPTHIDASPTPPAHYASPSILPLTYMYVPYPVSTELPSIALDIPLSSQHLPSHTLHPTDDTIVDLLPEWGRLPGRRPRTRRVHRLLHPSDTSAPSAPSAPLAPSAPSAPSQTPQDLIGQQVVYFRRRPKRNIKAPSCGTH